MAVGLTGHQRNAREKPKRPHICNQHKTKDGIRPVEYFDAESRPALRQGTPGGGIHPGKGVRRRFAGRLPLLRYLFNRYKIPLHTHFHQYCFHQDTSGQIIGGWSTIIRMILILIIFLHFLLVITPIIYRINSKDDDCNEYNT